VRIRGISTLACLAGGVNQGITVMHVKSLSTERGLWLSSR
jgi:hypothetical protein